MEGYSAYFNILFFAIIVWHHKKTYTVGTDDIHIWNRAVVRKAPSAVITIGYRQLAAFALQEIKQDWSRAGAVVSINLHPGSSAST